MNFRRTFAVTKRVFRDIKNDKRTIALMLLAPIFAMFVFGLAFSGDVEDVNVVVVNHDTGFQVPGGENLSLSQEIINNLDTKVLNIKYMSNDASAVGEVENGKAYAVIIFPENFTKTAYTGATNPSSNQSTQIVIMADESVVNIKNAIFSTVGDAATNTMEDQGINPAVKVNSDPVYGEGAEFIDFFVPGIMAFVVYLLTTLLTLLAFVGERTSGTLERILTTPVKESEIVCGYALAFGIVGTIQAAFLLAVGVLVFKIDVVGNVLLAFLVVALLAVVSQALGILLSSLAKREGQAVQFIPFIILPVFLLSGVFWPIEAIPTWLRPLSYLVPPTYAVDACRAVILKGWGLDKIWVDVAVLVAFAALFLVMAALSLKRKKD
jgi:ABC-2 type transport system permease protein